MRKDRSHLGTAKFLTCLLLIFGAALTAQAQFRVAPVTNIGDTITCHIGDEKYKLTPNKRLIYEISYAPTRAETQEIFDEVSDYTELRANIYTIPVLENDVNVQICPGDVNYIAYNADWLEAVYKETKNLWAVRAIIAHEIGHYVKAHALTSLGSNPKVELEADEYAGEVLAKMGACLPDAEAAYRSSIMRRNQASHTHPPIRERLAAVGRGWARFGKCSQPQQWPQWSLPQSQPQPSYPTQENLPISLAIVISGQSHTIYILPATGSPDTGSVALSGQNSSRTLYLAEGTSAQVVVSGQNNTIYVPQSLSGRVKFTNSGQQNRIIVR